MSDAVFEQYVDEFGNISVRVSNDVVVLTKEDADRVVAEYNQLKSENAELRVERDELENERANLLWLVRTLAFCADDRADCDQCAMNGKPHAAVAQSFCDGMTEKLRRYGVEVSQ